MVVQFACIFSYSLIVSEQYRPLGGYGSWAMRFMPWFYAGSHRVASILQFVPFSPLPSLSKDLADILKKKKMAALPSA